MMIKRIFSSLFIFICFALPIVASTHHLAIPDSLQNATPQERIDHLIKICRELMSQGKFDEITPKAEEALALSQQYAPCN